MSHLQNFCDEKHVKCDATLTDTPPPEGFVGSPNSWKVTLRYHGRRLTAPFFTGSACGEPTAADVISCLISDALFGEDDFREFCANLGYDEDSRGAERTWKACAAIGPKIRRLLGDDFDAFAAKEH